MWLAISKLLPFIYLATFTSAVAVYYQRDHKNKTDYATSKWREKLTNQPIPTENPLYQNSVRIRHSRFPNLDRISNRLDDIKASTKYKHTRTTTTTTTTTTTPISDGLLDDYEDDDLNYEDDDMEDDVLDKENEDENMWMMNDEQNPKDDDDDFLDYEEDDPALEDNYNLDEENDEQEPVEESTARSSLTDFKWRHYGTRSRVEESRRNQLKLSHHQDAFGGKIDPVRAVVAHTVRVNSEGRCKKPLPKVIPVQSEHPDVSKTYIPHCTILHRCAEDTGCCNNYGTRCAPKKLKLVHLYFYTKTLGQPGNKVERLPFYNHTECACLEKSKTTTTTGVNSTISFPRTGIAVRSANVGNYNYAMPENIKRCRCPGEYIPRLRVDMSCSCDCSESNYDCQRMKKGKEHFSLTDRRCILDKDCGIPSCEYGSYLKNAGRCPRKQEN